MRDAEGCDESVQVDAYVEQLLRAKTARSAMLGLAAWNNCSIDGDRADRSLSRAVPRPERSYSSLRPGNARSRR
jgi:hypothetical protein